MSYHHECTRPLRLEGKAYPRTCMKCGLGPCPADVAAGDSPGVPVELPPTDAQSALFRAVLLMQVALLRHQISRDDASLEKLVDSFGPLIALLAPAKDAG